VANFLIYLSDEDIKNLMENGKISFDNCEVVRDKSNITQADLQRAKKALKHRNKL
jgi:hypothetical protein